MRFDKFSLLPAELRCKIWRKAMEIPRLIELEWGPNLSEITGVRQGNHQWRRVCPRSRQPPAVFHVNRESRHEALSVYSLRSFHLAIRDSPTIIERYIYFNDVDILYFGENTCTSTLIRVFTGRH